MAYRYAPIWAASLGLVLGISACSGADAPAASAELPPAETPLSPGKGDSVAPGFAVTGAKGWYLVQNALTPGDSRFELQVTAPKKTRTVDLYLDDQPGVRLTRASGVFSGSIDISSLPVGEHRVLLSSNRSKHAFAQLDFVRSHPMYVFVSNDWDDPDNEDATLERQERLHAQHPELRLTHFVGPYTFTDPSVTQQRADYLASWVKGLRDAHGDEIGLHIHPYCSFVEAAGVECHTKPSFAKPYDDYTGYTVVLSSYGHDEMLKLLEGADQIFEQHGLGKPTSFRAGGWTAELHTLQALSDDGFVADASAANWSRMEEWKGVWGTSLYAWNQEHWSNIDDTSQPYHPSLADIQSDAPPALPLLELPDNGLLVDYVTAAEMVEVFRANFPGEALAQPKFLSIGYHPPNFSEQFFQRVDGALSEIDQHLASAGAGPVVYATASELAQVWSAPSQ